ncbi:MAG: hypothetical protein AAFX93_06470 [Verrucomicrobiota bacterium]
MDDQLTPEEQTLEKELSQILKSENHRLDPNQREVLYEAFAQKHTSMWQYWRWIIGPLVAGVALLLAIVLNQQPTPDTFPEFVDPIGVVVEITPIEWPTEAAIDARLQSAESQLNRLIHRNSNYSNQDRTDFKSLKLRISALKQELES